jgi:hypothetical protein
MRETGPDIPGQEEDQEDVMRIARKQRAPEALAGWYVEPYGAPTATSEVSRLSGFYSVEAMTAFGTRPGAEDAARLAAATVLAGRGPLAGKGVSGGH